MSLATDLDPSNSRERSLCPRPGANTSSRAAYFFHICLCVIWEYWSEFGVRQTLGTLENKNKNKIHGTCKMNKVLLNCMISYRILTILIS